MTRILIFALLLAVQDSQPQTGTISGTVVNALTGAPLGKVELLAAPVDSKEPPASTSTDANGNFAMIGMQPGKYRLKGHRNGYLDTYYGAKRPHTGGTAIALEPGEDLKSLQVKLVPCGVISGTVRDTDGEPMVGAGVALFREFYIGAGKREIHAAAELVTDDQGQYRAADLEPGKYYVRAEADSLSDFGSRSPVDHSRNPENSSPVLLPTLYPGVMEPGAARAVDLAAGARVSGIDVTLVRSRLYHVTVKASAGAGIALHDAWLYNAPPEWRYGLVVRSENRTPAGDFLFPGVPPGTYTLDVRAQGDDIHGRVPIVVGGDTEGVRVSVDPPLRVNGGVTLSGPDKLDLHEAQVFFEGGDESASGDIRADATFTVTVRPGRYDLFVGSERSLVSVQSVRVEGEDVYQKGLTVSAGMEGVEIVLSKDAGSVEGVVQGADDKPAAGATVVLVGMPRSRSDSYQQTTTDQYGRYRFDRVRPGDYKLFAWQDVEPGQWFDPEFLQQFEDRAQQITVTDGSSSKADLHAK